MTALLRFAEQFECASSGPRVRFNAQGERKIGGCFEGVATGSFVDAQVESFGPLRAVFGIDSGTDDPGFAGPVVNQLRGFNRAQDADAIDNRFCERRQLMGVQFVDVKAVSLPIFVQDDREIEVRLLFQPGDVGGDFGRF